MNSLQVLANSIDSLSVAMAKAELGKPFTKIQHSKIIKEFALSESKITKTLKVSIGHQTMHLMPYSYIGF